MIIDWSENRQSVPTCTTDEDDVLDFNTSGLPSPMAAILSRISETTTGVTRWLPAMLILLPSESFFFAKCQPLESGQVVYEH